jgi:hypothetical protein
MKPVMMPCARRLARRYSSMRLEDSGDHPYHNEWQQRQPGDAG